MDTVDTVDVVDRERSPYRDRRSHSLTESTPSTRSTVSTPHLPRTPLRPRLRRWSCQLEECEKRALRVLDDGESPGFLYISCGNHDLAAALF